MNLEDRSSNYRRGETLECWSSRLSVSTLLDMEWAEPRASGSDTNHTRRGNWWLSLKNGELVTRISLLAKRKVLIGSNEVNDTGEDFVEKEFETSCFKTRFFVFPSIFWAAHPLKPKIWSNTRARLSCRQSMLIRRETGAKKASIEKEEAKKPEKQIETKETGQRGHTKNKYTPDCGNVVSEARKAEDNRVYPTLRHPRHTRYTCVTGELTS